MIRMMMLGWLIVGASYPIGGASEIPLNIIPVIESAGGRVMMKARISNILNDGRRVTGVRVVTKDNTVDVHAPIVISDAGLVITLDFMMIMNYK